MHKFWSSSNELVRIAADISYSLLDMNHLLVNYTNTFEDDSTFVNNDKSSAQKKRVMKSWKECFMHGLTVKVLMFP
jgi:hypothetical protein